MLWNFSRTKDYAELALILIYTELRISELLQLKKSDVHLSEQWFHVVKSKTDAGIRDVPIADKILPIFERLMKTDGEYLIANKNSYYPYSTFKMKFWKPLIEELKTEHRPHDTRHTCKSRLAEAKVEQTVIKKIVDHTGAMSVTEKVYTHFDIKPLLEEINLI